MNAEQIAAPALELGRDPKALAAAEKLRTLIGRRLDSIEVTSAGVLFHFGPLNGDSGVVYCAYGVSR